MAEHSLNELSNDLFTVHREGESPEPPAEGISLLVDASGQPLSTAYGPDGDLSVRVFPETASLADFTSLMADDRILASLLMRRRLLVVLVDTAHEVKGIVSPNDLLTAVVNTTEARGDSELYGPAEGRAGTSALRCPHCGEVHHYTDVEPGETECVRCGSVLRPE